MIARHIDTPDREELNAELMLHLLHVKRTHRHRARHWRGFLRTALRNKALNWVRSEQTRRARLQPVQQRDSDPDPQEVLDQLVASPEPDLAIRPALDEVLAALDPPLREFWQVLLEERGHQGRVANRLRIHRNTVRSWIRTIQDLLKRHGF
jgi:RNA polymerase sigma factor (sigma-70 family)